MRINQFDGKALTLIADNTQRTGQFYLSADGVDGQYAIRGLNAVGTRMELARRLPGDRDLGDEKGIDYADETEPGPVVIDGDQAAIDAATFGVAFSRPARGADALDVKPLEIGLVAGVVDPVEENHEATTAEKPTEKPSTQDGVLLEQIDKPATPVRPTEIGPGQILNEDHVAVHKANVSTLHRLADDALSGVEGAAHALAHFVERLFGHGEEDLTAPPKAQE